MNRKWKWVALLLLGAVLLAGCQTGGAAEETDEKGTEPERSLPVSSLASYSIVYAEAGLDEALYHALQTLRGTLQARFGVSLPVRNDFVRSGDAAYAVGEHEILVGQTNREESRAACAALHRDLDYSIGLSGKKVVLAGLSHESVLAAVEAFTALLPPAGSNVFFSAELERFVPGTYAVSEVTLNGTALDRYTLVYTDSVACRTLAERLTEVIRERTGYLMQTMAVGSEKIDGPCIRIGTAEVLPEGDPGYPCFYAGGADGDVVLCGTDTPQLCRAVSRLTSALETASGSAAIVLQDGAVRCENTAMTSMSFNLLVNNVTEERIGRVLTVIRRHMPDTLGVQEASEEWMAALRSGLGDAYASVGVGRDAGGKGEHSAIFYRKALFTVEESGTKWLSDTPDTVSRVDGSICNRVFIYAVLRCTSDGKRFLCVNTHTDHAKDPSVRLAQVRVLTGFLAAHADLPAVISGDFNEIESEPSVQLMLASGFATASGLALEAERKPTFRSSVIDYFFLTKGAFNVFHYTVDDGLVDGEAPSDHFPILITYDLAG